MRSLFRRSDFQTAILRLTCRTCGLKRAAGERSRRRRKRSRGQLYYSARSNDIGCRHPIDLAPLDFVEEAGHGYRFVHRDHKPTATVLTDELTPAFTLHR